MHIQSIASVSFYTDHPEEMTEFYTTVLGGTLKVMMRYASFKDAKDFPVHMGIAERDPDLIYKIVIELAPGVQIELNPTYGERETRDPYDCDENYSHFSLPVDDIEEAVRELKEKGLESGTGILLEPSGTKHCFYHDPDCNAFELVQYSPQSFEIKGHIDPETGKEPQL